MVYVVKHRCFGGILWKVVNGPSVSMASRTEQSEHGWYGLYSWITQGNMFFFLNAKARTKFEVFLFSTLTLCFIVLYCSVL